MAANEESPLIKALPPESDYLTYLTIVEYNLTTENLPILHRVLQDETLNVNIGWDLVHLLLPFLPESQLCLQDIARLGNPREVILKVTESLRLIEYDEADHDGADEGPDFVPQSPAEGSTLLSKKIPTEDGMTRSGGSQMAELPPPPHYAVSRFVALLSMLAILHPRIKTQRPSRFLSTTLQAILASFSNATTHREEMVLAIVKAVKAISGIRRPTLPVRRSSGMLTSLPTSSSPAAADPEASTTSKATPQETAVHTKLLQSFVTHVVEEYMLNLPDETEVPGLAWCSRIMENVHPERIIPDSTTFATRFATEEKLHGRLDSVGQLVALAQDLSIDDEDLLVAAGEKERVAPLGGDDEDDPPSSADDIPLSRVGSLLLYTARQAAIVLYKSSNPVSSISFTIFPQHNQLLKSCLSSATQATGALGTEPEALIDAVIALGLIGLENNAIGEPASDEQFTEYLQVVALLSSNCPSPNLRGHAHCLTSTVLRSQPDDNVRLAFIRDTLEHCPFENLKVSAVGWIKGETIEANPPTPLHGSHQPANGVAEASSIFATPLALDSLAPFLFPSLKTDLVSAPLRESWTTFQTNLSFYLASLNFVYLLLCATHLHHDLGIADLWTSGDVAVSFVQPLREAGRRFSIAMDEGGALAEERSRAIVAELILLEETIGRVTAAVRFLNH